MSCSQMWASAESLPELCSSVSTFSGTPTDLDGTETPPSSPQCILVDTISGAKEIDDDINISLPQSTFLTLGSRSTAEMMNYRVEECTREIDSREKLEPIHGKKKLLYRPVVKLEGVKRSFAMGRANSDIGTYRWKRPDLEEEKTKVEPRSLQERRAFSCGELNNGKHLHLELPPLDVAAFLTSRSKKRHSLITRRSKLRTSWSVSPSPIISTETTESRFTIDDEPQEQTLISNGLLKFDDPHCQIPAVQKPIIRPTNAAELETPSPIDTLPLAYYY